MPQQQDTRVCIACGLEKPIAQFMAGNNSRRRCKPCQCDRVRVLNLCDRDERLALRKEWRDTPKAKDSTAAYKRKCRYGLPHEQFRQMVLGQHNQCAICCRDMGKKPCVDHCHITGKIRMLLCSRCNHGLGMFGDSLERLESAVLYLKSFE